MSLQIYVYRFVVSNALTIFYNLYVLFSLFIEFIKNPFAKHKVLPKLMPPPQLADPKYGLHKYTKVNNIKLHYVESGDSSKPLMVFIHGYPEFWYSWRYQILDFNKDYWCIAVDLRGYGDSERPEGVASYKVDTLALDIRELIRQLGRDKCILVSHDWGGAIACKFRDVYPDMLLSVVVLASTSLEALHQEIWNNPKQKLKSWYIFFYRAPMIPEYFMQLKYVDAFNQMMKVKGKNTVSNDDIECYTYWFGKQFAFTPPINYYRANFDYYQPEKPLCERNVPMLAAHAAKDAYLNHNLLEIMKKQYKYIETAIVDNCSHFLQQEEPEKVNKLIRDFLNKHCII